MEDYEQLKKILLDSILNITKKKGFDFDLLLERIESEFVRLGFRDESENAVKNILLIRLDFVGDFIITTPSIRAIRENYPSAYITLVVSKKVYPVAEICPYVNEVLEFDTNFDVYNIFRVLSKSFQFAEKYLWKNRYDLCIYFSGLGTDGDILRSILPYISGAKERIGYNWDALCNLLHTLPVNWRPKEIVHECMRALNLLEAYGLKINSTHTEIWFNKANLHKAYKIMNNFANGRVKVAAGIGASNPARIYPIEKYLVAFKKIIAKGASIVILGGSEDYESAKFLEDNLPAEFVKNLVSMKTDWLTSAAVISMTDMYIGNDTAGKHIAATLKKSVIYLSRVAKDLILSDDSSEVQIFYPWQTKALVLQPEHQIEECVNQNSFIGCKSKKPHCITQIKPEEIVAAFDEMLKFMKN